MWDRLADRIASVLADAGAATALLPKQHVNLRELQVSTCEQTAAALKVALAGCHRLATLAEVAARMPLGDSAEQNFDEMAAHNKSRFEEWQRNQCPDPMGARHTRSDRAHARHLASFEGNEPELADPEQLDSEPGTNPDRCCGTCRFQGDGGMGQHPNSCRRCETEGETAGWEPRDLASVAESRVGQICVCGKGRDTDGDGDCPACAKRTPVVAGRIEEDPF